MIILGIIGIACVTILLIWLIADIFAPDATEDDWHGFVRRK